MNFDERQPILSFRDLRKSARILDVLTVAYFPIYGLSQRDFFRMYPTLAYMEALVYRADSHVEAWQAASSPSGTPPWEVMKREMLEFAAAQGLESGLLHRYIHEQARYYESETAFLRQSEPTEEGLMTAQALRPSDLRIQHSLLLELSGREGNPDVFAALAPMEVWAEINDDLGSYEADIERDHFNTLRTLTAIHGAAAADVVTGILKTCEREFFHQLRKLPATTQTVITESLAAFHQHIPPTAVPQPVLEASATSEV
ncbi:MAG: hypothetical protein AAF628_04405 [Planctomycetota bacterium]